LNKKVLHSAVSLLSRREHSQQEIFTKLLKKDFIADDIQPVLEHLMVKNYLSDERFAESVCRYRANKGFGWAYIKNELNQKGVSLDIINQLRNNNEIDWYLQAELAYNKRFGFSPIDNQKEKAKRIRFLQYRGYSYEQIMTVVNTGE